MSRSASSIFFLRTLTCCSHVRQGTLSRESRTVHPSRYGFAISMGSPCCRKVKLSALKKPCVKQAAVSHECSYSIILLFTVRNTRRNRKPQQLGESGGGWSQRRAGVRTTFEDINPHLPTRRPVAAVAAAYTRSASQIENLPPSACFTQAYV